MRISIFLLINLFIFFVLPKTNAQDTWPVATPQSVGMNKDSLEAFDKDIASGKYGNVDGMVITRNGKLVYQKYYKHDYAKIYGDSAKITSALNPHDPGGPYNYYNPWWHPYYHNSDLHSLQSVTKTITSIIIGVAITNKDFPDISTKVLSFFDTSKVKNIDDRKRSMTIRDLLTMTAGFDWNENVHYSDPRNDCTLMEASFDWVEYTINKPMAVEPGKSFNYNSGASQILSYIFRKATGKDIEEYAVKNLFLPLGIHRYFWKRIPNGLADTEGGLYLAATDLAKLFYLYLQNGKWEGEQLIKPDWVKASVTPFVTVGGTVKYGYKWWLYEYGANAKPAWAGSGFGGQWPVIIPEYNIVAVFTGWNIIQGKPSLRVSESLRRLVNAVSDKK
jgi:CubicO group peptidase (beta-lactamase class C family)